jgi:cytochrome c oxidase accessory protein FixG
MEHIPMNEKFRDSISTINESGKRAWVYAKKPKGVLYTYRSYLSYVLLAFLVSAPFIKVQGNPLLMFNVLERRFSIFGFPIWPQDFHLFVITMIIGVVGLALFTVAFGRIFCGWICPQTIFMEMVFRKIDYWIEGDRGAQMRLDKQAWNAEKIRKKGLKWLIYAVISFLIANVFLAYLISSDVLLGYILEGPEAHMTTLITLLIFTGVFYWVFAWFREQVCVIACPYGRLQGVLLDRKTVVVAYDHVRGEGENGRKKFKKDEDRDALGHGDCIDCNQCVHVCPTGIDIRNGTQLECVNCTACIDECDTVMEKIGKPKGLVRYASEAEITERTPFVFTWRMKAYSAVLVVLIGVLVVMLSMRNSVEATILRLPGQVFQHTGAGKLSNVYTFKLINKTNVDLDSVELKLIDTRGILKMVSNDWIKIPAQGLVGGTFFVEKSPAEVTGAKEKMTIGVYRSGRLIETTQVHFLGPRSFHD